MNASSRPLLARIALLAVWALAVGLGVSVLAAAVRVAEYAGAPLAVVVPLFGRSLRWGLPFGALSVLIWIALFSGLARPLPGERLRALLATAVPWAVASAALGYLVNRALLPGFLELPSLLANAALGALFLAVLPLLSRCALTWWRSRWRPARRPSWPLLGVLAALPLAVAGVLAVDLRGEARPNVVVLLIDVLRADHLGAYGYERATSPNIDRFAEEAILFEQAVAQSTFTKTSVASLFTGLYPHRHGVYNAANFHNPEEGVTADTLSRDLATVAEGMAAGGYLTVAWVHNSQLRGYMGFDQGFARYVDQAGKIEKQAAMFDRWQELVGRHVPFFAYLHFLDLHGPYLPHEPWKSKFGRYSDAFADLDMENWRHYRNAVRSGEIVPTAADVEQLRALYDGQLAFVDDQVGRILDDMRANGTYDDSLVIITGDHGDAFMEHGFISHSHTPYEELVRVPLIVKLPDSRHGGRRVREQVALVDVAPTLLEFAGAPGSRGMDGESLLPILSEGRPGDDDRPIFSEHRDTVALRRGGWKYIAHPDGREELYDLTRDPGERHDLSAERRDVVALFVPWVSEAIVARESLDETRRVEVDPESIEQLRALGYLDP